MQHNTSWFLILNLMMLFVCGCIEVRDKKGAEETPLVPAMVEVQKFDELIVSEDLYIYEGKLLTKTQLEYEKFRLKEELSRAVRDYEFSFEHIEFKEGVTLYTLGNRVRLHTKTLSATKARVTSFPQNQKAPPGVPGRSGGHILFEIGVAEGNLLFEMRGENGGDGLAGKAPDDSLKGASGKEGMPANCKSLLIPKSFNGGPGEPGKKGFPGENGERGGDAGTLEILVHESGAFMPEIKKIPGQGGHGGAGGAGGAGGDGGKAGRRFPLCPEAKAGSPGPQGASGDPGMRGEDGVANTACINKDTRTFCY
ncbi:hypothetical protein [Bdellovibrio bacteriovorus]|uniref:hypothetical protein n=1 Tax=Bdellovibrio bacteriovorus TaxID=959 RepID=UPI0035A6330F